MKRKTVFVALLCIVAILITACASEMRRTTTRQQDYRPMTERPEQLPDRSVASRVRASRTMAPQQLPDRAMRAAAPPGSLPALDEEVWVIVKHDAVATYDDPVPGGGMISCLPPWNVPPSPTWRDYVQVPLDHTDVTADISGYIASVNVKQAFTNPYDQKIEAVYTFPLPDNAAVSDFVMTIGERRIRGILREREEAEQIYREARQRGHNAALLVQDRPNVFTQKVANIEPRKQIDIDITYFHTLTYDDGWYAYVFPMVVGPRYNPPGSRDGVGAVSSHPRASSGQATDVHYLSPRQRSGHDISVAVNINMGGISIHDIESPSHDVNISRHGQDEANVTLARHDQLPNKDFVLRYRVADSAVQTGLVTTIDPQTNQGYFALMVYPPRELRDQEREPVEMVFVLDCSGSMRGEPLQLAKDAVAAALDRMDDRDTFQIFRFSDSATKLASRGPVPATRRNIADARSYLAGVNAGGGTMMVEGIKAALDFPRDAERTRYVVFMTDGFIGNEVDVLREMQSRMGDSRVFSFGIGSSPNRYLLNRMAKLGRGAVAYIGLRQDADEVMAMFFDRTAHPVASNLTVDIPGGYDILPASLPDLYVGRPVLVTGRFDAHSAATGEAQISADVRGQRVQRIIHVPRTALHHNRGLSKAWARSHIANLMDQSMFDTAGQTAHRIRQFALEHGLMSAYTAFIAVDTSRRTKGDGGVTVPVAVPVPDGVRYDTTVGTGELR